MGLEDREQLALEFGLPAFPRDYPETPAGRGYWAALSARAAARQRRRPAKKRVEPPGVPCEWKGDGDGEGLVVLRRAAVLEAAVAVPGGGFLGQVFPVGQKEEEGETEQKAKASPVGRPRPWGRTAATALVPRPRYRRLGDAQQQEEGDGPQASIPPPVAAAAAAAHAAVLLPCRWGGRPSALAAVLAPAPADYRAWRREQAEAAEQRRRRAAALQQAAARRADAAMATAPTTSSSSDRRRPPWAPSARPAALPHGATERLALGWVASGGGFALGAGHAVARGLVSVAQFRAMQAGAARGVPAPMAGLVLVRDERSGVAYPASLHFECYA